MFLSKPKAAGMVVLVLGTSAAVLAYQGGATPFGHPPYPTVTTTLAEVAVPEFLTPSKDVTDWPAGWPGLTNPPEKAAKNKAILDALEKPIPMRFSNATPLEEVLRYLRNATEGPGLPKGISIYVDPIGLQDADKTTADTVTIDLEDLPLKRTLRLLLKQLSLAYEVDDGVLIITSTGCNTDISPMGIMYEKARRGELSREQYNQLIEALKLWKQVESLTLDPVMPAGDARLGGLGGANPAGTGKLGGMM